MPENLSRAHRRLIYRPTKHSILTSDAGISVSISDEEDIKLKPMSLLDRPEKQKSLARIAQLLGEDSSADAWSNLLPFLQGMKSSHQPVPPSFLERMTRKANSHGLQRLIMECAEKAEATGAELSAPFFTRELLYGCHRQALDASYKGEKFEKVVRQAWQIAFLLEKNEHCGPKKVYHEGHVDMRRSLFVNSVLLELNAAHILFSSQEPTDSAGEVGRGVARVLALSQSPTTGLPDFSMEEFFLHGTAGSNNARITPSVELGRACQRLENLLPVWSGLEFANKIPGAVSKENKSAVSERLAQVTDAINKADGEVKSLARGNQDLRSLFTMQELRRVHA